MLSFAISRSREQKRAPSHTLRWVSVAALISASTARRLEGWAAMRGLSPFELARDRRFQRQRACRAVVAVDDSHRDCVAASAPAFAATTQSGAPDARISASPRARRHSRDGRGGAVRVSAAAADPGRSRRDPGRRQRDARAARAHPHLARTERTALHPVLHLDRQAAAWRSRRVADFERAGAANDRPARRAVDQHRGVDHHPLDRWSRCRSA